MYLAKRNLVTLEDLDSNNRLIPRFNAGLLSEQPTIEIFNRVFYIYWQNQIDKAIITVIQRLNKIPIEQRPELTYDMVAEELTIPDYATTVYNEVMRDFTSFLEYNKYQCDGSCGKFSIFNLKPHTPISLTDKQVIAVEYLDIEYLCIQFLGYADTATQVDNTIIAKKYYTFFNACYTKFDFKALLPKTLEYEGFYHRADGGEGIYDVTDETVTPDVGVYLKLKNVMYKRRYKHRVKAVWFGIGYKGEVTGKIFSHLLNTYDTIEFTSHVCNVYLDTMLTVDITNRPLMLLGKGTRINFILDNPMEYCIKFIDTTNSVSLDIRGFNFDVKGSTNNLVQTFNVQGIKYPYIKIKTNYSTTQDGIELMLTDKDYINLGNIHFAALPNLTTSEEPKALATVEMLSKKNYTNFLTKSTSQTVTAAHTYKTINITDSSVTYNSAIPYSKLESLYPKVLAKITEKIETHKFTATFIPPVGYNTALGSSYTASQLANMFPGTQWEQVNQLSATLENTITPQSIVKSTGLDGFATLYPNKIFRRIR